MHSQESTTMYILGLTAIITLFYLYQRSRIENFSYGYPPHSYNMRVLFPAYGMPYPGMYQGQDTSELTPTPTSAPTSAPTTPPATTSAPAPTTTATGTPTPTRTATPTAKTTVVASAATDVEGEKIKTQISTWLSSIYAFWSSGIQDIADGSFPSDIDGEGKTIAAVAGKAVTASSGDGQGRKTLIQQSRYLWFFSTYSVKKSAPAALEIAKKIKGYMVPKKLTNGFFPYILDSTPADERIHLYANYFAIYGLSAYIIASKTAAPAEADNAKTVALGIFDAIQTKFLYKPSTVPAGLGYMSSTTLYEGEPVTDKLEGYTQPVMSLVAVLHGIEALTELYDATKEARVGTSLKMLMELLLKMYIATEFRILNHYDPNLTPEAQKAVPKYDFIDYGHNLEMVFLMEFAVTALSLTAAEKDRYMKPMKDMANNMLVSGTKSAWDTTLKAAKDNNGPTKDSQKDWWTQFTVMTTCGWMYKTTNDVKYRAILGDMNNFVNTHFWTDLGGGKGEFKSTIEKKGTAWVSEGRNKYIATNWKSNYHVGRSLILLDEWLKK